MRRFASQRSGVAFGGTITSGSSSSPSVVTVASASSRTRIAPDGTCTLALTSTCLTRPAVPASTAVSSFMLSMTATGSPTSSWSPGATADRHHDAGHRGAHEAAVVAHELVGGAVDLHVVMRASGRRHRTNISAGDSHPTLEPGPCGGVRRRRGRRPSAPGSGSVRRATTSSTYRPPRWQSSTRRERSLATWGRPRRPHAKKLAWAPMSSLS